MKLNKRVIALLRSALRICKNRRGPDLRCLLIEPARITAISPTDHMTLQLEEPLATEWQSGPVAVPAKMFEAALAVSKTELRVEFLSQGAILTLNGVTADAQKGNQLLQDHAAAFAEPPQAGQPEIFGIDLDPAFYEQVLRVCTARATADIRTYFTGLQIDVGRRRLVASDGHRLHCADNALPPMETLALGPIPEQARNDFICGPGALAELLVLRPTRMVIREGLAKPGKHAAPIPPLMVFQGAVDGVRWTLRSSCVAGVFPDPDRVVNALPLPQRQEMVLKQRAHRPGKLTGGFPVSVLMPNYADELDQYIKAMMKVKGTAGEIPILVLDLRKGVLRSVDQAPVALSLPVTTKDVTPEIEEILATSGEDLCGVRAPYLRDAMRSLGETKEWTVSNLDTWQCLDETGFKAVVMPSRLR
jgi:hypothetical protein